MSPPGSPPDSPCDSPPDSPCDLGGAFRGSTSSYTRQQLRAARFTRVARDLYVREPPTSYAGLADLPLRDRVTAAVRLVPDGVVGLWTAAALCGLRADDDGLVHLVRPLSATQSEHPGIRVHRYPLREDEWFVHEALGIRVCTGPRVLTDLAAHLSLDALVVVGDAVLNRASREVVEAAARRARRRPGVLLLRSALPLMAQGSDSARETQSRLVLHRSGFTGLVHGVQVSDGRGGWLAAPDLADPVARVAYDGSTHFDGDARQRRQDVGRDEATRAQGWEVVIGTSLDFPRTDQLVDRVASAYLRQARFLGAHVLPAHLRWRAA
jgi:hypothetical protein